MRFTNVLGICLALCIAAPVMHAQQQLQVYVRLADSNGAPVLDPAADTFRILEDGVESKVVKVEPVNWPLKLQVLLDNGLGIGSEHLGQIRNSLRDLVNSVPETAEVTIVTTAPQPRFLVRATRDRKAQLAGIDRLTSDSGSGQFIASLAEALKRVERDKSDHVPVILSIGTTTGDANPNNNDVNDISRALKTVRTATVHVVMVSSPGFTASGGGNQVEIGTMAAKATRGRYEAINAPSALGGLLVGFAEQIGASFNSAGGRFRVTVERPAGRSGAVGRIGVAARGGYTPSEIIVEQR